MKLQPPRPQTKERAAAVQRVAEINGNKDPRWSPMDRENTLTYIGAFEEGYAYAAASTDTANPNQG
jgi:hypothetical protein